MYSDINDHHIVITDNGEGFNTSDPGESNDKLHVGLSYAREQVEGICGGKIAVESTPGRGTKVHISLPRENNTIFSLRHKNEKMDSN